MQGTEYAGRIASTVAGEPLANLAPRSGLHHHHVLAHEVTEHRLGGAVRHDPPSGKHGEGIAQPLGLVHVVRGENDSEALRTQVIDEVPHPHAGLRIETRGGFVQKEQTRAMHDGPGDHQATTVTSRKGLRLLPRIRAELEPVEQLRHPPAQRGRAGTEIAGGDGQVLLNRKVAVKGIVLGADSDRALGAGQIARELDAVHVDLPGVGPEEAVEHPQRGRLAGAVGTEQAEDLPRRADEIHAVDHAPPAKMLDQPTSLEEHGHNL